jgi:GNAT superfamily N-acetyltransferase
VDWREEAISTSHDRRSFDCGSQELNEYLQRYARQNHVGGSSKTFVAVDPDNPARILGYYTISPGSFDFDALPPDLRTRFGRYPVPVFRLARLAVDRTMQRLGLGGDLLLAAAERAMAVAQEVGGVGLIIDAKHDEAAAWYRRFGAVPLLDSPLTLFLPFSMIEQVLADNPTGE